MNEKLIVLINKLEKIRGLKEFFDTLKNYFSENFSDLNFDIIKVIPYPPYYLKITDKEIDKSFLSVFSESKKVLRDDRLLVVEEYYIYALNEYATSQYLLIFKYLTDKDIDVINELCGNIDGFYNIVLNNYHFGLEERDLQNANLISQMSHDINSMISLIKNKSLEMDVSVLNKMNYIEKMTKDVLQYVRDVQIIDSEVKIEELLQGIIQNRVFPENIEVSTNYNLKEKSIYLDVELIDRALSEIIQNSVSSFEDKKGNIRIEANIRQTKNLFFDNEYLEIFIEDNGSGINADFISFIKNPFFTTKKSDNHSGLGLSIADKIITAHGGRLNIDITKKNKTIVIVYLPLQGKYNE